GTEVLLAVVHEDVRDRFAGNVFDVGVGVPERGAERLRDQLPHGRLPRAGRSDDDAHRPCPWRLPGGKRVGAHRITRFSMYPARLRRISATESPPNFSVAASASTSATMASATTAAAGTAHTSE